MLQKLKEELVMKTSELNLLKNKKKELELDIFNKEKSLSDLKNEIELLQMIKNYEIKDGTEINVLRINEDCCCFDIVAKLKYSDNHLLWSPGTFRSSMLWNDNYLFEIDQSNKIKY